MLLHVVTAIFCVASTVIAQTYGSTSPLLPAVPGNGTGPDANGKYHVQAEGIRAYFIPYGASISNLFINDTRGVERDIVLGFDNATYYSIDRQHPHLSGVPGMSLILRADSALTRCKGDTRIVSKTRPLPSTA